MRGARGIEFGVDLPAIPAIGLGSVLPTSARRTVNNTPPTDQGDGWGFGDWTRFVGAWKKSKSEAANLDKDKTATESRDLPQTQTQTEHLEHEDPEVKRARECLANDEVVRSSTDTLSAVFDWLIERVPAPTRILGGSEGDANVNGAGTGQSEVKANLTDKEQEVEAARSLEKLEKQATTSPSWEEKKLSALAATYTVGHGVGSSTTSSSTSEIRRRMDSEKAALKKKPNELGSKDDLERFYVALTRKMYDEGL